MSWCEAHQVDYLRGLAKNSRLKVVLASAMAEARALYEASGEAERLFRNFRYYVRESWSCEHRMIGKAEHLAKSENSRFI